jgi:hypothetical protein
MIRWRMVSRGPLNLQIQWGEAQENLNHTFKHLLLHNCNQVCLTYHCFPNAQNLEGSSWRGRDCVDTAKGQLTSWTLQWHREMDGGIRHGWVQREVVHESRGSVSPTFLAPVRLWYYVNSPLPDPSVRKDLLTLSHHLTGCPRPCLPLFCFSASSQFPRKLEWQKHPEAMNYLQLQLYI